MTIPEDALLLQNWLSEPEILRWFPMSDAREIEDATRIWVGYARYGAALTALWGGSPCGMATLYLQPFKKLAHTCLFSIIVAQEQRGKGIGGALIRELMRVAKEQFAIEVLHLEVYEGNPAQRLYERLGFQEFGRQKHFIREADGYLSKIFMQRQLE